MGTEITYWVDGACSGNPGPGGYGVVCLNKCYSRTISEYIERYKPIKFEYSHSFVYKKNVKIISYFLANSLNKGNKFGDMMSDMNQSNVQTEYVSTIISKEDCDFGIMKFYLMKMIMLQI